MLAATFAIIAALMHVAAVFLYNRNMRRGTSTPNPATWTLWVILSTLNCATYLASTHDVIKSALPLVSTVVTLYLFLNALRLGKFKALDRYEVTALTFGCIAAGVWIIFQSSKAAYLLLQIPIVISFYPTYRGVWRDPTTEQRVLPWYLWSGAYVFSLTAIFLQWKFDPRLDDGPYQLVYPVLCLILHGGVGLLAQRHPKKLLS